jgi:hypothetical protein
MKQTGQRDMLKKTLQECLYINHCGISCPLVSYSINLFSYDNFRKQKRTLITLNQQMKEISNQNTPLISFSIQAKKQ